MSGNCCQRAILAGMMLLAWTVLIVLGGLASLMLLHHVAFFLPPGPYHDLYATLLVFLSWPFFTLTLRFALRHGCLNLIGLWP